MLSVRTLSVLAIGLLAVAANAQVTVGPGTATFVDISTTGTAITGAGDDSAHGFTSTVGNVLFPAGSVVVTSNGTLISGATPGSSIYFNSPITPTSDGTQFGYGAANPVICPFWDDLYASGNPGGTLYWQEISGVLYVQWQNIGHYPTAAGPGITFQVQIVNGPPCALGTINMVYPDATFGGAQAANDTGASATVGYVAGGGANAQYSFDTPGSIPDGTSLVVSGYGPFTLTFSSPNGPGSIQVNICGGSPNGAYQIFASLVAGAFPNGWLHGLDISFQDVQNQINAAPFFGGLDSNGAAQIGPTGAGSLPSGLTIYSLVFNIPPSSIPTIHTAVQAYTIP